MFSRRKFLAGSSLAAGSVALCRPVFPETAANTLAASSDQIQHAFLETRRRQIASQDPRIFLGYPANMNLASEGMVNWCRELSQVEFGSRTMNNVGDPFHDDPPYGSHSLERDLVARFAERYGFPPDNLWGMVSHSGTDSNMHGAYIGRTLLKQRTGREPKIFYTSEAHYSIQIVRDLLGLEEVLIRTNDDASMDIDDLEQQLARNPDVPVLLIATIGTTFKGGIDDIDQIQERLKKRESYLHLDAALFGGYLQASSHAQILHQDREGVRRYDSLAVSWHKFFGYHAVAGLFICARDAFESYRDYFSMVHDPAYISHVPGTITCSRDPIKPAQVHYYCTRSAIARQEADAKLVIENTAYLQAQMQRNFPQLAPQRASDLSNIVYFNNYLPAKLVKRWSLATIRGKGADKRGLAHVVVMPHASKALLDQFLNEVEQSMKA